MNPTPGQIRALVRRDKLLGAALKRVASFPGFPEGRPYDSHFHALAKAVVYQQLAGKAASTIHDRVRRLTPGSRFPTPEAILELPPVTRGRDRVTERSLRPIVAEPEWKKQRALWSGVRGCQS